MTIPGNESASIYYRMYQDSFIDCREKECASCPERLLCDGFGEYEDDYSYNCEKKCKDCNYNCSVRKHKYEEEK